MTTERANALREAADEYEKHARETARREQRLIPWEMQCDWMRKRADELDDPRVRTDKYVIYPTDYEKIPYADKDVWAISVVNGHAYGWSVRKSAFSDSPYAMNRKGEWILESRGSGHNKARRYTREEAIALALKYVDTLKVMGLTAQDAIKKGEVDE